MQNSPLCKFDALFSKLTSVAQKSSEKTTLNSNNAETPEHKKFNSFHLEKALKFSKLIRFESKYIYL